MLNTAMLPVRRLTLIGFFVLATSFVLFVVINIIHQDTTLELTTSYALPELPSLEGLYDTNSHYAVAVDGSMATTNSTAIRPTASTAKMILGLAIMQEKPFGLGEPGETITITDEYYNIYTWYANNGGSYSAVAPGEEISEYEALMSVFLPSSNNMADTLASWAFGSLENYRTYAAAMLSEWRIMHTTIGVDASGFDESTTSTAADLAIIGQKVLENPVLAEIVNTTDYAVPVAGELHNTNALLGESGIIGVKTGYIGSPSGYCLVSGYRQDDHLITTALLGAETRAESFADSLAITERLQATLNEVTLVNSEQIVGEYKSWWTGAVPILATKEQSGLGWSEASYHYGLDMEGATGVLLVQIGTSDYAIPVMASENYRPEPSFWERFLHVFGWQKE